MNAAKVLLQMLLLALVNLVTPENIVKALDQFLAFVGSLIGTDSFFYGPLVEIVKFLQSQPDLIDTVVETIKAMLSFGADGDGEPLPAELAPIAQPLAAMRAAMNGE